MCVAIRMKGTTIMLDRGSFATMCELSAIRFEDLA